MPFSEVDIYNLALTNAKSKAFVQTPTEDSLERKYCTANFKPSVGAVLEQVDWKSHSKAVALQLMATAGDGSANQPRGAWQYAYKYPQDCVQFREILRDTDNEDLVPFDIVMNGDGTGKLILTDKQNAIGRYTAENYSVNLMSPLMIDTIGWRLAMRIAPPLIGENAPLRFLTQMFTNSLAIAETANKNQALKRKNQDPELITARG